MNLTVRAARVLSDEEMGKIHAAALRVWERVPLRAQGTDEFFQHLSDFGCDIKGDLVCFPVPVREKVLARIEEGRQANGPGRPAEVSASELHYSASGQALYCCDIETNKLRPATTKDLEDWSRLCDMFPRLGRAHPTFIPQDVPVGTRDVHAFATIILSSSRPWPVSVYTAEMIPYFMDLQAVCDGSVEKVKAKPGFHAKCWMNTPFMMTAENIKMGMMARELLDRPFQISLMPVAGTATPVTLAGAIVQTVAEVLACNTVTLALDDRLCGWCAAPLAADMRTGCHTQAGPDVELFRLGGAQMGAYVFGGEYRPVASPTTMAKVPGPQSMMDKALCSMWAICNGVRSFGSLGIVACADVGSPVQLILDVELMGYYERLLKGITVDQDHLAEEVICEVAPTGARYLEHEHTARFCRDEMWTPELVDRRVPMAWMQNPRTLLENAVAKTKKLLAEAPNRCTLTEAQREEVKKILADADARASSIQRL